MANIEVFADSLSHSAAGLCRHEAVRYNDSAHAAVLEDLRHTDYKRVVEINAARQSELAREQPIRQTIYGMLGAATKDEKIQLSIVLARSGDKDSIPSLETLSMDADPDALMAIRA